MDLLTQIAASETSEFLEESAPIFGGGVLTEVLAAGDEDEESELDGDAFGEDDEDFEEDDELAEDDEFLDDEDEAFGDVDDDDAEEEEEEEDDEL